MDSTAKDDRSADSPFGRVLHHGPVRAAFSSRPASAGSYRLAVDGTQDTAATVRGAERLITTRRPVLGVFLYDAEG